MIRFYYEHPLDNFQAEMTQVTEPKLMPFTRLSACDVFYYLHQVFLGQETFTISNCTNKMDKMTVKMPVSPRRVKNCSCINKELIRERPGESGHIILSG